MTFKVIFVGDSGAGKTALIKKALTKAFEPTTKTIGADFFVKQEQRDSIYQIWDVGGDKDYDAIAEHFYHHSNVAVLCIDLSQQFNEKSIQSYLNKIKSKVPEATVLLVGTKNDLSDKEKQDQFEAFAEELKYPYFLTSAKTGERVDELFKKLPCLAKKAERSLASPLYEALKELKATISHLPPAKQAAVTKEADTLISVLQAPCDINAKLQAITTFEANCHATLSPTPVKEALKAVTALVIAAVVTLLAAAVGFGIGFAFGIWTGPGAFISGIGAGSMAASIALSVSMGLGAGASGLSVYGLFKSLPEENAVTALSNNIKGLSLNDEKIPEDVTGITTFSAIS